MMERESSVLAGYSSQAWLLALVIAMVTMSSGSLLTPILPTLKDYFGLTGTGAALIVSSLSFARLLVDLPAGVLVDRFSHRALLVGGALVTAAGATVSAGAVTFPMLLLGQVLCGIGLNCCLIAAMVAFSDLGHARNRGSMFGLYTAATMISASLSPIVAGVMTASLGWQSAFAFGGLVAAGAAVIAWTALKLPAAHAMAATGTHEIPLPSGEMVSSGAGAQSERRASLGIYAVVFLLFLGSSGISHTAIPIYADETLRFSASTIGWVAGLSMLFRSGASLVGGRLGDRFGYRLIVTVSLMILGISFLVFNAASDVGGFLAGMLFISVGHAGSALPNAWLVNLSPKSRWGRLLGANRLAADLAHVVGPVFILAVMEQWSFAAATVLGAVLMWVAALVATTVVTRR